MIDIKLIRENPDYVKNALAKRGYEAHFDSFLLLEQKRKDIIGESELLRNKRNIASKEIPVILKKGGDASELIDEMKIVSDNVKVLDEKLFRLLDETSEFLESLPNLPDDDVVAGGKENNEVIKTHGDIPKFDFEPKDHVELATSLGLIKSRNLSPSSELLFTSLAQLFIYTIFFIKDIGLYFNSSI